MFKWTHFVCWQWLFANWDNFNPIFWIYSLRDKTIIFNSLSLWRFQASLGTRKWRKHSWCVCSWLFNYTFVIKRVTIWRQGWNNKWTCSHFSTLIITCQGCNHRCAASLGKNLFLFFVIYLIGSFEYSFSLKNRIALEITVFSNMPLILVVPYFILFCINLI